MMKIQLFKSSTTLLPDKSPLLRSKFPLHRMPTCEHRFIICAANNKGFGAPKSQTLSKEAACPCCSGKRYTECCKTYHDGADPPTAENLMRARFSAYAKGRNNPNLVDFIVKSTHPDNSAAKGTPAPESAPNNGSTLEEDVKATCDKINWERLKVLSKENGSSPNEAYVTFQTYFKVCGQQGKLAKGSHQQSFVERSRFLKEDGRWLYVDGKQEWKQDAEPSKERVNL